MSDITEIDVRDLNSVRRAAKKDAGTPNVVLGDDWVQPQGVGDNELVEDRRKRGLYNLRKSPLAKKIVTFNLIAMILLIAGVLYLNPSRDSLAYQRANGLVNEAELIADVLEAQMPATAPISLMTADGIDVVATLEQMDLRGGIDVAVFDKDGSLVASTVGATDGSSISGLNRNESDTILTDFLASTWIGVADRFRIMFGDWREERGGPNQETVLNKTF